MIQFVYASGVAHILIITWTLCKYFKTQPVLSACKMPDPQLLQDL